MNCDVYNILYYLLQLQIKFLFFYFFDLHISILSADKLVTKCCMAIHCNIWLESFRCNSL